MRHHVEVATLQRVSNSVYRALGLLFVGLGVAGVFIPLMPTTIFLILAVGCFSKSDPRLEAWLLNHPTFGPTLRDWSRSRSIRLSTKRVACATVFVVFLLSILLVPLMAAKVGLAATGIAICAYILTRRTAPEVPTISPY